MKLLDGLFIILVLSVCDYVQCQDTPKFNQSLITIIVSEDTSPGQHLIDLVDFVVYSNKEELSFQIENEGTQILSYTPTNGALFLKTKLDRENKDGYQFKAYVTTIISGTLIKTSTFIYVFVSDENDNAPRFTSPSTFSVYENATVGSRIFSIEADDPDSEINGEVNFKLSLNSEVFGLKNFLTNDAAVILLKPLDYEAVKSYTLKVEAADSGDESLKTETLITINVLDVPDTNPKFLTSSYNKGVLENLSVGSSVLQVQAFDGDTGINDNITYSIVQGNDADMFSIGEYTGILSVENEMDIEKKLHYSIKVQATEQLNQSASSVVEVVVFLQDVNDNRPTFQQENYVVKVQENIANGTVIETTFSVTDADILAINKQFEYSLEAGFDLFKVNRLTGDLIVNSVLDYEVKDTYTFKVFATETNTAEQYVGNATVFVELENVNDNKPVFDHSSYKYTVVESLKIGDVVGYVQATDDDKGILGIVTYNIDASSKFSINETSGAILIKEPLDFETKTHHKVKITAHDGGPSNEQNKIETIVDIFVTDYNDNAPVFANLPSEVTIKENQVNSTLFVVQATDADSGQSAETVFLLTNSTYALSHFTINTTSGRIGLSKSLNFEEVASIKVAVTVMDMAKENALSSTSFLTVNVGDVNDNTPLFNQSVYTGDALETNSISLFVLQVFATDLDAGVNGMLVYAITHGNIHDTFTIQSDGKIVTQKAIDREQIQSFNLTVSVRDSGSPPLSSQCRVLIQVQDQNDEGPVFTKSNYAAEISEAANIGDTVITVTATDKDVGENGQIKYSFDSGKNMDDFHINQSTGVVTVSKQLDRETIPQYTLVLKAEDIQGTNINPRNAILTIDVLDSNDNTPTFTNADRGFYTFDIHENLPNQTTLGYITAVDKDGTTPVYSILGGDQKGNEEKWSESSSLEYTDAEESVSDEENSSDVSVEINEENPRNTSVSESEGFTNQHDDRFDKNKAYEDLIELIFSMTKFKRQFRRGQDIYKTRIQTDNDNMDGYKYASDIRSAYLYLHRRFETVQGHSSDQDVDVQDCLYLVREAINCDPSRIKQLNGVYSLLMEMALEKEEFHKTERIHRNRVKEDIRTIDFNQDVDDLRDAYYYLIRRITKLQEYTKEQDEGLEECFNILGLVLDDEEDDEGRCVDKSEQAPPLTFTPSPPKCEKRGRSRSRKHHIRQSAINFASKQLTPTPPPSPPRHRSRVPSRGPVGKAIVPLDGPSKKGLPSVPCHVVGPSRIVPPSTFKIFSEKVPKYKITSSGYGACVKPRAPQKKAVKRSTVKLPPIQNAVEEQRAACSIAAFTNSFEMKKGSIKGLVKPHLFRKDLMNLADPTVRPRGSKPSSVSHQTGVRPRASKPSPDGHQSDMRSISSKPSSIGDQTPSTKKVGRIPVLAGSQWQSRFKRLPQIPTTSTPVGGVPQFLPEPPKAPRVRVAGPSYRHFATIEGSPPRQW